MEINSKNSILFVCLGNICRSPAAEAIFLHLLSNLNLKEQFSVDSAGTSGHHTGQGSDKRMQLALQERGIPIQVISRKFIPKDFLRFDKVLVMDDSNFKNVLQLDLHDEFSHKVEKITNYLSSQYAFKEIPDPYYGDEEGFNLVIDLLEDALNNFLDKFKSNN